jgi:hypothetical protein
MQQSSARESAGSSSVSGPASRQASPAHHQQQQQQAFYPAAADGQHAQHAESAGSSAIAPPLLASSPGSRPLTVKESELVNHLGRLQFVRLIGRHALFFSSTFHLADSFPLLSHLQFLATAPSQWRPGPYGPSPLAGGAPPPNVPVSDGPPGASSSATPNGAATTSKASSAELEELRSMPDGSFLANRAFHLPMSAPCESINRFALPNGESVSCVLWSGLYHVTGTDIGPSLLVHLSPVSPHD